MTSPPKKILVFITAGIGNVLISTPFFHVLKKHFPEGEITAVVLPNGSAEILQRSKNVDRVLTMDNRTKDLRRDIAYAYDLKGYNFDTSFTLFPSSPFWSAYIAKLARIPKRIGHKYPWRFIKNTDWFLTESHNLTNIHDVVQNLHLLKFLNIAPNKPLQIPLEFPLTHDDRSQADKLLKSQNLSSSDDILAIHPGSNPKMSYKRWPKEYFSTLINLAVKQGKKVIVITGKDEKDVAQYFYGRFNDNPDVSLLDNAPLGLIAAGLKFCKLTISNDSAIMHLSTAAGTPTIGLFGLSPIFRTAPWGPGHKAIKAPKCGQPLYTFWAPKMIKLSSAQKDCMKSMKPQAVNNMIRDLC